MSTYASAVRFLAVSFHAEKLHDDEVWRRVERVAVAAAARGAPMTFFVHPFWPAQAGVDITGRIRRLAALGHEIGLHTHYYDVDTTTTGNKTGDLAPANVVRRLDEDLAAVTRAGFRPRGFVSGAWALPECLTAWLAGHDFTYDCSYRTYPLPYENPAATAGDGAKGPFWLSEGLLELPTTAPLRPGAFGLLRRHPPAVARVDDVEYQLVYLHDDDLLDPRKRATLGLLVNGFRRRGHRCTTVGDLADLVRTRVGVAS